MSDLAALYVKSKSNVITLVGSLYKIGMKHNRVPYHRILLSFEKFFVVMRHTCMKFTMQHLLAFFASKIRTTL